MKDISKIAWSLLQEKQNTDWVTALLNTSVQFTMVILNFELPRTSILHRTSASLPLVIQSVLMRSRVHFRHVCLN